MAYTYQSSGTPGVGVSGANIDLSSSAPSGVSAGDLLLLFTGQRGTTTGAPSLTAGWTLLKTTGYSSSGSAEIYARIADGTAADAPSTIDWGGTAAAVAHLERWSGGGYTDLATIVAHSASDSGTAATLILPALTPATVDNCLVVGYSIKNNTATDATTISHSVLTKRTQYVSTVNGRVHAASGSLLQTTAADYGGTDFTINGTSESLGSRGVVVYLKTASAAPTFTVPATVSSQTTTAYTLSFTSDSSSTIYGVAVIAGSAAPSIAQIKAGQNGAGAAAKAAANKAVTGADTLVLTPSDSPAFPVYDLYCVLSNGGGDSARRTLAGEYLDAPTGKNFVTLTSLDATSPLYGTGAAISDTVVIDTTTDPDAYVVTCAVDGTVSYVAGGDDSRQLVDADVYDYSAGAYLGAGVLVFNNLAPDSGGAAFAEALLYRKSVAITAVDLAALAPDPESDTVTVTALDALPAGLSVGSNELTGTPSVYGSSNVDFQWEDQYGATYTETANIQIGDLVPDVVGQVQANAVAAIEAVASLTTSLSTASSPTVASSNVISTDPAAGTLVAYDAVIGVVVSSGSSLTITTTTLAGGARDSAYYAVLSANGDVTAWSVDAGDLPAGLTLENSTGVISGTPTVAGSYAFTIGATNGVASDTQALTLTISGVAPTITTTELTRAIQGEAYSAQVAATGDATITYAVTSGALPYGLSLSTSGAITGTPTELGGHAFTVTATNSEGSDAQDLGLSVVAPSLGFVLTMKHLRNQINLRRRRDG